MRPESLLLPSVLALTLVAAPAAAAAVYCPNPGLDCQRVLVVPVKYAQPLCPNPTQFCLPDLTPFQDPPRIHATLIAPMLNEEVNAHYDRWSYGNWQFEFETLVNPDSADGWWTMPGNLQQYLVALRSGADFWTRGTGERAIVEDAIEVIAADGVRNGLIQPLALYSRFLVLDNQHARYGQATTVTYDVPALFQNGAWVDKPHLFTGTLAGIDVSDAALVPLVSHEVGHQLGYVDYYGNCVVHETPLSPFVSECNGPWDVMALDALGPAHPTAFNKLKTGWLPHDNQRVRTLPVPGGELFVSLNLHPIERIDLVQARVVRIPLTQPLEGAGFEGYHLECRRHIEGDDALPEEGVLIQWVLDAAPGVAPGGMPARVVRADSPFTAIESAALQPGGIWVEPARGIEVTFNGYADGSPQAACQVDVRYHPMDTQPDPAFKVVFDTTPDLWIDSPVNGLGVYPSSQTLDADGVPSGQGDPFAVGGANELRFRVRNSGTAPTPPLGVHLVVVQPPFVGCAGEGPKILDSTVFIPPIPVGDVYLGNVELFVPEPTLIRARANILPVADELSTANNAAQRIFSSPQQVSGFDMGQAQPLVVPIATANNCPGDLLIALIPFELPQLPLPQPDPVLDRWRVLDPGLTVLAEGESAVIPLTVVPPAGATVGSGVTLSVAALAGGGLPAANADFGTADRHSLGTIPLRIPVVEPSVVEIAVPLGPHVADQPVVVSGTLSPAMDGSVVGLKFTLPDGQTVMRPTATDGMGGYSRTLFPADAGGWRVEALWQGDDTRLTTQSDQVGFVVVPDRICAADPDCADDNPCTLESCNMDGNCEYALLGDGQPCDDADACTAGSFCQAGVCGVPVTCVDVDVCTTDVCDPSSGDCTYEPRTLSVVTGLRFDSPSRMTWDPTPGAADWNTYRGTVRHDGTWTYNETCFEPGDAFADGILVTADDQLPPQGDVFYYLVTEQTLCGEGPVGTLASGELRAPPNPCTRTVAGAQEAD